MIKAKFIGLINGFRTFIFIVIFVIPSNSLLSTVTILNWSNSIIITVVITIAIAAITIKSTIIIFAVAAVIIATVIIAFVVATITTTITITTVATAATATTTTTIVIIIAIAATAVVGQETVSVFKLLAFMKSIIIMEIEIIIALQFMLIIMPVAKEVVALLKGKSIGSSSAIVRAIVTEGNLIAEAFTKVTIAAIMSRFLAPKSSDLSLYIIPCH